MLPSPSGRFRATGATALVFVVGIVCLVLGGAAAQSPSPEGKKGKGEGKKRAAAPTGIPLPIGQEAKGLVLPDYDTDGKLRARFEAGTAKRVDADRIVFASLKMTTYTPEETPDLSIDMPESTLHMGTRVISSENRTTITRSDFSISGDKMTFDTNSRQGTLVGNVKMVITGTSTLMEKPAE
jgi:lipopolysaccharide assembly outer membrane protein LptD (OstA)